MLIADTHRALYLPNAKAYELQSVLKYGKRYRIRGLFAMVRSTKVNEYFYTILETGDPSGQTWNYRDITLLYNFTTALLIMVSSITMARIVSVLLNIY